MPQTTTNKFKEIIFIISLLSTHLAYADQPIQNLKAHVKLKTNILVLGTMHLRTIKEPLDKNALAPIVAKLQQFSPTAIGIEALRPADIISMLNGVDEYKDVLEQFVGSTFLSLAAKEQNALNITPSQAFTQLTKLIASHATINEQRETLIKLAVAAYDKNTALLHWQYFPQSYTFPNLSKALQDYLKQQAAKNNEINLLAISLAKKSGLNKLIPIDDHLDKDLYSAVIEQLMPSFKKSTHSQAIRKSEYVTKPMKLLEQAVKTGDWLALYSWVNSEEYKAQVTNDEWRLFVDKDLAVKPSLARIALWEVRNLNMASNIMRIVAENIGGNIVIIVGANHKVFFEDYLSRMIGVNIVQFNNIND